MTTRITRIALCIFTLAACALGAVACTSSEPTAPAVSAESGAVQMDSIPKPTSGGGGVSTQTDTTGGGSRGGGGTIGGN